MDALLVGFVALIALLLALILVVLSEGAVTSPVSRGVARFAAGGTSVVAALAAIGALLSMLSSR